MRDIKGQGTEIIQSRHLNRLGTYILIKVELFTPIYAVGKRIIHQYMHILLMIRFHCYFLEREIKMTILRNYCSEELFGFDFLTG